MIRSTGALFAITGIKICLSSTGPTLAAVGAGDEASMAARAILTVIRWMMRVCRMLVSRAG